MEYFKVKLEFNHKEKDRFYRVLLVKKDLNLVNLGVGIVTAFNGTLEHNFLFTTKTRSYVPRVFMEEGPMNNDVLMDDYTINDLSKEFSFEYDTGEGYEFKSKIYAKTYTLDSNEEILLIEGAGAGIFEDNISSLYAYLDGDIDKEDSTKELTDNGYVLPWNLNLEKFGDFDTMFNIAAEAIDFYDRYLFDLSEYKKGEAEYFGLEYVSDRDFYSKYEDNADMSIHVQSQLLDIVDMQIESFDYVRETYVRLIEKHMFLDSKVLIATLLMDEIKRSFENNKVFDEKHYKEELKKLN